MFKSLLANQNASQSCTAADNASDLKAGDVVVVYGHQAKIDAIWYEAETARTVISLDYGVHGKGKVYGHDRGKLWNKLSSMN